MAYPYFPITFLGIQSSYFVFKATFTTPTYINFIWGSDFEMANSEILSKMDYLSIDFRSAWNLVFSSLKIF